jgi:hypothetical protein
MRPPQRLRETRYVSIFTFVPVNQENWVPANACACDIRSAWVRRKATCAALALGNAVVNCVANQVVVK